MNPGFPKYEKELTAQGATGFGGGSDSGVGSGYGLPGGQAHQMQVQYMKDQLRQELQQRSFLSHAQVKSSVFCSVPPE